MQIFRRFLVVLLGVLIVGAVVYAGWLRERYVVPILMYHHVGTPSGSKWRLNSVSEKSFDYQMGFMKRHGFHVISLDELVQGIKAGQAFPHHTVAITFDDGYEDNYLHAFPILKKYGFPAMVFLISDKIGRRGFLTWDQIKEMEKSGFAAGAHTRHHIYLPMADTDEAQDEIAGSKKIIEDNLGHSIDYFAYPTGGFTPEDKQILQDAGFKAAVTTNRGKDRFNHDLYELKRVHMNSTDDRYGGLILWFKLSGYYNLSRQFKSNGIHHKVLIND